MRRYAFIMSVTIISLVIASYLNRASSLAAEEQQTVDIANGGKRIITEMPYIESPWSKGPSPALAGQPPHVGQERVNGRIRYIINGVPQKAYDEVIQGSFGFDPFNRHFVYLVRNGKTQFILFDQREDPAYPAIKVLSFMSRLGDSSERLAKVMNENFVGQPEGGERDPRRYQWMFFFSRDGAHGAYVVQDGDGQRVIADGKPGQKYARIGTLCYSRTGGHLAYTALVGTQWRVVVDEKEQPTFPAILEQEMIFSSDGAHLAYPITDRKQVRVVVDGIPQQASFLQIEQGSLTFSSDGAHLAFVASPAVGKQVVVLDGQAGTPYDEIRRSLLFSPDGRHLAYMARIGPYVGIPGGAGATMPDGEEEVHYQGIFGGYGGSDGIGPNTHWVAVVDGKAEKPYPYIVLRGAAFSPDGQHFAYSAYLGKKRWAAVIDGKEATRYDGVADFTFSPDSKRVAYGVRIGNRVAVIVDGQQSPLLDVLAAYCFRFSRDSTRFLYVPMSKQRDQSWVVVDHKPSSLRYTYLIGNAEFTPDSRYVVYAARRFDRSVPHDSKITDYVTVNNSERAYRYVIITYDGTTPNGQAIFFDGPNKFHYFVDKEEGKTYAVQEEL
ncbi:MAG: WD40 repeat domain-containing protein [Armatimonadota bacterium]